MRRLVGLTGEQLETRERVLEGLVTKALCQTVKTLSLRPLTAAGEPPAISTTAASTGVTATLPPLELATVPTTWQAYVASELYPFLLETYSAAAEATAEAVYEQLGIALPRLLEGAAEAYLASAKNRLVGIGDLLWSQLRMQLAEGYAAGESTHQLAARIRQTAALTEPRALVIARTEVIPAANAASLEQLQLAFTDEECSKEWLSTNDTRTREAHRKADGQRVPIHQAFSVGGEALPYPGWPGGSPENVISCRCSLAFVFADDAEDEDGEEDLDETLVADAAFEKKHPRDTEGQFTDSPSGLASKLWSDLGSVANGTVLLTGKLKSGVPARLTKGSDSSGNFIRVGIYHSSGSEWDDTWGSARDENALRTKLESPIFDWNQRGEERTKTETKTKSVEVKSSPTATDRASTGETKTSTFTDISASEAGEMQRKMYDPKKWSEKQVTAVGRYTDSAYETINGYLRDPASVPAEWVAAIKEDVKTLNSIMRPSTRDVTLYRGVFDHKILGVDSLEDLESLIGKTGVTRGFSSTRLQRDTGHGSACGHCITLNIRAPKGTKMAYVAPHSTNPHEEEVLLPGGVRYRITGVERPTGKNKPWQLIMEVVE